MERIYDQLNNKAYPSIQKKITNIDFEKKMTKFKKNFRTQLNQKSTSEKKFLSPKKVFEDLHHKTHFKAAYTIYLNYKSCLQDKAAEEMRRDEDIRESMHFPKPNLRMSHANLNFNKLASQTGNLDAMTKNNTLRKSYNDTLQRTYEDFEMETDDSVVEIDKAPLTQRNLRQSTETWNSNHMIKSLSPHLRSSMQVFDHTAEGRYALPNEMFATRETFISRKDNIDSAKENYRNLKNKAKSALEKSNYLRRKHFKGDTLHKGEGRLFMTNGMTNSMYDSTITRANEKFVKH